MSAIIGGIMIVAGVGIVLFGAFLGSLHDNRGGIIPFFQMMSIPLLLGLPLMYLGAKRIR